MRTFLLYYLHGEKEWGRERETETETERERERERERKRRRRTGGEERGEERRGRTELILSLIKNPCL
jgi:hypothetical protein